MREIALYYPYIHIQNDTWLKAAALYWPRLARLVPPGYPRFDSSVARALDEELGFFVNIPPPAQQLIDHDNAFLTFVRKNAEEIRRRYPPGGAGECSPPWHDMWIEMAAVKQLWNPDGPIQWTEVKATPLLRDELQGFGLARRTGKHSNLTMHPVLGAAYTTALIDRVALANDLATVTDQQRLHEIHRPGDGIEFMATLLDDKPRGDPKRNSDEIAAMYAALAVESVIPRNLHVIPVSKIVKVRRELAAEFDIFHEHLQALTAEFEKLTDIEIPAILQARLQLIIDRDLHRPTAVLERSLRQLGLEPAKAVLGLKTLDLPAIAAAATSATGIPLAAGQAGLVAARLIATSVESRSTKRAERQSGPGGYVLGLRQQLMPRGVLARVRRAGRSPSASD